MAQMYGPWITQGEFIERLVANYGVRVEKVLLAEFSDSNPRVLRRIGEVGEEIGFVAPPGKDDSKLITPDSIEYVCRRLMIDPRDFNVVPED